MFQIKTWLMAIAGVTCVTIGSAVTADSVHAAVINYDFRVDVADGPLANQSFLGNFSYDDAALSDPSIEIIDPINGNQIINPTNGLLSLSFNFLGQTYTAKSDSAFPDYPQLNFEAGLFQRLDYFVESVVNPNFVAVFATGFNPKTNTSIFLSLTGDPNNLERSTGTVSYNAQPIPTPTLLPGLIGLGIGILRKRRAEAKEQLVES